MTRNVNLVVRHLLSVVNHGRTPALILSYEVRSGALIEGTEFSPDRLSNKYVRNLHVFLGSDKEMALEAVDLDALFADVKDISDGVGTGAFCVTIKYADIIAGGPEQRAAHETSFVYYYNSLASSLERISIYNKYT